MGRDNKMELIAQSDIKAGEEILTRYTTPQIGSFQRVEDIQKTWHFVCGCVRCRDPSELGSMMSGVKCETELCPGLMLPRRPTVSGSPWSCLSCGKTVGVSKIHSIINSAVKLIGANRDGDNDLLLETVTTLEVSLHQNHYLIIGLKEIIIQRLMRNIRKQ